jgi:hypothetical protein
MKRFNGNIIKEFYTEEFSYPSELLIDNKKYQPKKDEKFLDKINIPISKQFKLNKKVVILNKDYFGSMGVIKKFEKPGIILEINKNNDFERIQYPEKEIGKFTNLVNNEQYFDFHEVLKKLDISNYKTLDTLLDFFLIKFNKKIYNIGLGKINIILIIIKI